MVNSNDTIIDKIKIVVEMGDTKVTYALSTGSKIKITTPKESTDGIGSAVELQGFIVSRRIEREA